jgi:hypothetical protein
MNDQEQSFMNVLENMSGSATNKKMMEELGVEKGTYLFVRAGLISQGLIKLGRGQGGMVHVVSDEPTESMPDCKIPSAIKDPFPEGWR